MCLKSGGSGLLESKKGARSRRKKLLYGIRTIRSYRELTTEAKGKLSLCYEKNISQDTTAEKFSCLAVRRGFWAVFGYRKFVIREDADRLSQTQLFGSRVYCGIYNAPLGDSSRRLQLIKVLFFSVRSSPRSKLPQAPRSSFVEVPDAFSRLAQE